MTAGTDTGYEALPAHVDLPALDHDVIAQWERGDVFRRSLKANEGGTIWMFYEGPPTANGKPGTHHVEARVFKDLFPRYKTMQGFHVAAQGRLGLPRPAGRARGGEGTRLHRQARHRGVRDRRVQRPLPRVVHRHVDAFRQMSERMGYWADYEHAYWTMTRTTSSRSGGRCKQIFDKGLLVEDFRVTPYCPRCGTGLSDHEVAQGYEEITDPSVYVRFPVTSGELVRRRRPAGLDHHAVDAGVQHRRRREPRRRVRRGRRPATALRSWRST